MSAGTCSFTSRPRVTLTTSASHAFSFPDFRIPDTQILTTDLSGFKGPGCPVRGISDGSNGAKFDQLMAALDTPWLTSMGPSSTYKPEDGSSATQPTYDPNPPTIAAFAPSTLSGASTINSRQRSTVIVHKKSPLLVATPPQVTRALAYSHPFLLPLNKLLGLLSWSSGDPWESFLLVAGFWAIALYGNEIILWAGPIILVAGLMIGMYSRRYSPLSSTTQTGEKHGPSHRREPSESSSLRQHKSLDEIVETLREFTTRCNLLLDPFIRLTDFLSTQSTPTSATTRPALTTLFIRILLVTPLWILLTLPPLYILTTRRVILTFGTIALTWHSRPARVSRVILWRSLTVRRICSFLTGLSFSDKLTTNAADQQNAPPLPVRLGQKSQVTTASHLATRKPSSAGVRFTFVLYENQRRWLGIGWTYSLLAYERAPWTDEHLNPAPSKDTFELPEVEGGFAKWRWIEGSEWKIEGGNTTPASARPASVKSGKSSASTQSKDGDGGGWIYYDNKWTDGRRGVDSWGRYTRRRKWYRDAELVEITPSAEVTPSISPRLGGDGGTDIADQPESENLESKPTEQPALGSDGANETDPISPSGKDQDSASVKSKEKQRSSGWFGTSRKDRSASKGSSSTAKMSVETSASGGSGKSRDEEGEEIAHDTWRSGQGERERQGKQAGGWGVGEDAAMGLS